MTRLSAVRGGFAPRWASLMLCVASTSGSGCADREAHARDDGTRVVRAFEAVMSAAEGQRAAPLQAMRSLRVTDVAATRARDTCLVMFDAVAHATEIQESLEPISARIGELLDAGVPVSEAQRANMMLLYREASASTDRAAAALDPCVRGIDRLRVHGTRRR